MMKELKNDNIRLLLVGTFDQGYEKEIHELIKHTVNYRTLIYYPPHFYPRIGGLLVTSPHFYPRIGVLLVCDKSSNNDTHAQVP